ncbi:helix-turn-helix transcriptional regulator [Streptomyces luteireticuli]|uniref:helix-turn-helix transcriptional regulator n=1 Tax=Streptomyces luteireticuli TaxID=173858 RepID=UPI0035574419
MHTLRPVANGLRTDHPVPDLPFVDDAHIPVDDRVAIEAIGRHAGEGMWGREDNDREDGWRAFTTDRYRHDLAWCVRYHPKHGRSVLLMRDEDAAHMHMEWHYGPLLFRLGGYWWDGTTWYRPGQVWDAASEDFDRRPVRSAITVTAADLLDDSAQPANAQIIKIANFTADTPLPGRWQDHLALWADRRKQRGDEEQLPLSRCVVKLSAPELAGDQLIGATELAELGGIAPSTLRSYISRGEGDVPPPQATISGRSAWARPVAHDWVEQRRRSPESVAATVAAKDNANLSIGAAEVRDRYTDEFFNRLWEPPARRKRWVVRQRNEATVREVAGELAWSVAVDLDGILPTDALAATIRHAILDELASCKDLLGDEGDPVFYAIIPDVAKMLDWLIRHHPTTAQYMIGELIGDAERRFQIPRNVTAQSLRTALGLDGKLDKDARNEFLDRVLPPTSAEH